jgi:putative phosphoesterase
MDRAGRPRVAKRSARPRPALAIRHERVRLPVARDATLRLVVVADTHSRPHPAAHERIAALRPDAILHGGDIGDLAVLDDLARIAPLHAVRGNIDDRASAIPDVMTLAVGDDDATRAVLLLMHIVVAGPRIRADAARIARAEGAGTIVCGHSHVPFIGRDRGLVVFNPGSVGPRRFVLPIVFGVMELGPTSMSMRHVDVETGETWLPP